VLESDVTHVAKILFRSARLRIMCLLRNVIYSHRIGSVGILWASVQALSARERGTGNVFGGALYDMIVYRQLKGVD
jgi:hypothetical protein